jgi:hypothetical protein
MSNYVTITVPYRTAVLMEAALDRSLAEKGPLRWAAPENRRGLREAQHELTNAILAEGRDD